MATALNTLSDLAYRLRQSRATGIAFLAALAVCVGMIALARVEGSEDGSVYPLTGRSSTISLINRYVAAEGRLLADQPYESRAEVGGITLTGARYIPLVIEGAPDPVYVYERGLPAPDANGVTRVTGRLNVGTGSQPATYIEVGAPPNLLLQNVLARLGVILGGLLALSWLLMWWLSRKDYAIGAFSPAAEGPASVGALWFGGLGAEYGNAVVRQAPVRIVRTAHGLKLESEDGQAPWAVHLRAVKRARATSVATAYGALSAARLEFEDERGLARHGTLAVGGDAAARAQLRGLIEPKPAAHVQAL